MGENFELALSESLISLTESLDKRCDRFKLLAHPKMDELLLGDEEWLILVAVSVCVCVCVQMLSISRLSKQNNNKIRKVTCQKVA